MAKNVHIFAIHKKGLTLIELLMAMSISIILLGALYAVYSTSYQVYKSSINKAELNQNARIALERIGRDLRQTSSIKTVLPPNDIDLLNPPASEIQFVDGHNTNQIRYVRYYLQGGNLHRQVIHYFFTSNNDAWVPWNASESIGVLQESIDEDVVKADQVTALKFFGNNPTIVQITTANNQGNYTYQTEVWGRNM